MRSVEHLSGARHPLPGSLSEGWRAELELAYVGQGGATRSVFRRHCGPLRVLRAFRHPDGCCEHIVVHPPGGVAGGDVLRIGVSLSSGADVLLTSNGAAKWYRAFGREAKQVLTARLEGGAFLEWMPSETILYNGARAALRTRIDVDETSRLLYGDVVCLGRPAAGEAFTDGEWRQRSEVYRRGRLIWCEHIVHRADESGRADAAVLAGSPVVGLLLWVGPEVPTDISEAARSVSAQGATSVAQLSDAWIARYVGDSTEDALAWLRRLRAVLHRHSHGREARVPRIWST